MSDNINEFGQQSPKYITSSNETAFVIDWMTGAMKNIDTDHTYIHQGIFFEVSISANLTAGGTYNIVFTTPASNYIHFRPASINSSADKLSIALYEGCTVTGGATANIYNHNRTKTAAATMIVTTSASVTSNGTLIHQSLIGGGTGVGGSRSGAETGQKNEWILNPSTNYCMRFSNGSSGANSFIANAVWYEQASGG